MLGQVGLKMRGGASEPRSLHLGIDRDCAFLPGPTLASSLLSPSPWSLARRQGDLPRAQYTVITGGKPRG